MCEFSTYYVYDGKGLLRYVFPPGLTDEMVSGSDFTPTQSQLDDWAFQYKYDHRRRMTQKKVPGSGWVYLVYDNRDRVILTQDANQRAQDDWLFTKYDALNRPVITGIFSDTTSVRDSIQSVVNSFFANSANEWYEVFEGPEAPLFGYTNDAYPTGIDSLDVLTTTYYDTYNFRDSLFQFGNDYLFQSAHLFGLPSSNNKIVQGQVTGSLTHFFDGTDKWISTVSYYDSKYRNIQTISENVLEAIDISSYQVDFAGQVKSSKTTHDDGSSTLVVVRDLTYDHAGRLLSIDHGIDGESSVRIVEMKYNELGQLLEKDLDDGSESLDYEYNIRGWMKAINDAELTDEPDDLFGMELFYNDVDVDLGNTGTFNGNISGQKWSGFRGYAYEYDGLNRLTNADYIINDAYDVDNISYDLNGNIDTLRRKSPISLATSGIMDDLVYTYSGNQLIKVDDSKDDDAGFIDGAAVTTEYTYDSNGNLLSDENKGIDEIDYNHLNLPTKVEKDDGQYIRYIYDAAGIKLAQEVYNASDVLQKRTDYVGEFVYEKIGAGSKELILVNHEEGRIVKNPADDWVYQYHIKDHLGNTRLTFSSEQMESDYKATMELSSAAEEESVFTNLSRISGQSYNGSYSNVVYGDDIIGVGIMLPVAKGDSIDITVWAKYESGGSPSSVHSNADLIDAIAAAFGGLDGSSSGEEQFFFDSFDDALGTLGFGGYNSNNIPAAYLNWIFFDAGMNYDNTSGYKQISSSSQDSWGSLTENNLVAAKNGFVYIYVSNESSQTGKKVWFDDLEVIHKGKIVQTDDYYPFGLTFNSWSRSGELANDYLFNGIERQDELDLGWDLTEFRSYSPEIGRWHQIDPKVSERESGYVGFANNPILYADPLGDTVRNQSQAEIQAIVSDLNKIYKDKYDFDGAFSVTERKKTKKVRTNDWSFFKPSTWGNIFEAAEYEEVTETDYAIATNEEFDWGSDEYTSAMSDLVSMKGDITLDIIEDNGTEYQSQLTSIDGFLSDYGGGYTVSSNKVLLSDKLGQSNGANKQIQWTTGAVALHELIYHVHKQGKKDAQTASGANRLRLFYRLRTGKNHGAGSNQIN